MPETASPLDSRLRAFFGEIKTQGLPQQFVGFRPAHVRPRRRTINLLVGAAGVGVVAAGVALFAVELSGHHGSGSPIPAGQTSPTLNPNPTLPFRPSIPSDVHGAKVLIPLTYGTGPRTLPTITLPPNESLGYEYGCISNQPTATATSMSVTVSADFEGSAGWSNFLAGGCSNPEGGSAGYQLLGGAQASGGQLQTVRVSLGIKTEPSVDWVVLVYEFPSSVIPVLHPTLPTSGSSPTTAALPEGVAPPGATVILPLTHGTGPARLPTFTWTPNDMLYVSYGCGGGVAGDTVTFAGDNSTFDGDFSTGTCSGPVALVAGSGTQGVAGGPVSLTVKAAPSLKWAIFIYEAPPGLLGPGP